MKLNELLMNQQVAVQFNVGDEVIEFHSNVMDRNSEGIYINPYIHNGKPLELNIDTDDNVICNIFADDQAADKRVSWRNVSLTTANQDSQILYFVKTSKFNELSNNDERRRNERMPVKKAAKLYDNGSGKYMTIVVNDVSENGISFLANSKYVPSSYQLDMIFEDSIAEKMFKLKVSCSVERTETKEGNMLYGCSIKGENKDYLLYVLFKKLSYKQYKKAS